MTTGILIVVLLAFGAYIYKFPPNKKPSKPMDPNKICMDYSKENISELRVDLIHEMVKGYKNNQLNFINRHTDFKPKEDAHSIWFDLEILKKFLYHIEKTTKDTAALNKKEIDSKNLGVRIYYSTYPDKETWKSKYQDLSLFLGNTEKEQYEHMHTLVVIPTIRKEDKNLDFNPLEYSTYANGLYDQPGYVVTNTISTTKTTVAMNAKMDTSNSGTGAQNHGTLIPPATNGGQGGFGI